MTKVKVNEGKVYCVTYEINDAPDKTYLYYVYAVNEEHARQIVESYDEEAIIKDVTEEYDAISQHYGEQETKFVWHSTMGEYDLKDNELVLVADKLGYHLCRYDKKKDVWRSLDGKEATGGHAFMPLPEPSEAFAEAWEQIKDEPYAYLSELRNYAKK